MYPTAKVSEEHDFTASNQLHLIYALKLSTSWTVHMAPSGEYVENTANKQTAEISTSRIAIVSMPHCYPRQRRTEF